LENLEKIRRTNGPASAVAVDSKKLITSSVEVGKNNKSCNMWCHYCDKANHNTANCKAIMRAKQHKKAKSESKAVTGKKTLSFLFEEINALKKQLKPAKGANTKQRKAEFLLSTEINLTNSSDEDEEYFALPST
jgi:hypothetical protein